MFDYLEFYRGARGLDFTALALANVYGPRQDPHGEGGVIAVFARMMLAGEQPAIHGDGSQNRDYVFVDDTSRFSLEAGELSARCRTSGRDRDDRDGHLPDAGRDHGYARRTGFDPAPTLAR